MEADMAARKTSKTKARASATKRRPRRNRIANVRTNRALDLEARVLIEDARPKKRPTAKNGKNAKKKSSRSKASSGSMLKAGKRMLQRAAKEMGELFAEPA